MALRKIVEPFGASCATAATMYSVPSGPSARWSIASIPAVSAGWPSAYDPPPQPAKQRMTPSVPIFLSWVVRPDDATSSEPSRKKVMSTTAPSQA
jgi:hypothetical protein